MNIAAVAIAALLIAGVQPEERLESRAEAAPPRILKVKVLGPDGEVLPDSTVLTSIWTEQPGFKTTREYPTDADGLAVVELPKTYTIVRLWAWKKPLLRLYANWEQKELAAGHDLPDEYVFRLEPGVRAVGRVLNESGQPIVGAKVAVSLAKPVHPPGSDGRVRYDSPNGSGDEVVTTDAEGRWQIDHAPAFEQAELSLRVEHPDYVAGAQTARRGETAVSLLKRGVVPLGRVTGPDGAAIADALVIPDGNPKRAGRTDAYGHFRLPAVAPGTTALTVIAPRFTPQSRRADLRRDGPPEDFELAPGKPLALRITDTEGRPIPKASVTPKRWGGNGVLENLAFAETDVGIPRRANDAGHWTWEGAPADLVTLTIGAKGFAPAEVEMAGGEPERTVTLRPEHRITGRVTDAATGEMIRAFTVTPIDVFRPHWLHAERGNSVKGKDGHLDYLATRTDIPLRLRLEAAGYRTLTGPEFRVGDGSPLTQDFSLEPSPPITGAVADADGHPVADAEVLLATPTQAADLSDNWGNHSTRTNAEGRFSIPDPGEPWTVIARSDAGIAFSAEFPAGEWDAGTLQLQPWASIRGRFVDGGGPVSGATVYLRPMRIDSLDRPQFETRAQAVTDSDGRFEFLRVPPGRSALSVHLGPWRDEGFRSGPNVPLDLAAGEAREQDLGTDGALLSGKVTLTGHVPEDLDCTYSLNYLVRREADLAPPAEIAALGFEIANGWQEAWPNTSEGMAYLRTLPHWFVKLAPDGTFRISGVPAGEYIFAVAVYAKPSGCLIDPLARHVIPVTVTADDVARGTISLPEISAEVRPVPAVGDLPELTFRLPNDSGGTLADCRGHLTLVHFWASWCGPCKAQLPALKRLQEQYAARGLDVLGLSLDEEQDAWLATLSHSEFPERQGLIGPKNNAGVSGVPAYWLLGEDGRIVAKGYTPDELISAIAERLGQGEAAADKVAR